jgi:hypothetical protein
MANPSDAKLASQTQLLFRGETLRGLLLNVYGWSQIGLYSFWAGVGLALAAFVVLGTLVFELVVARTPRGAPSG